MLINLVIYRSNMIFFSANGCTKWKREREEETVEDRLLYLFILYEYWYRVLCWYSWLLKTRTNEIHDQQCMNFPQKRERKRGKSTAKFYGYIYTMRLNNVINTQHYKKVSRSP